MCGIAGLITKNSKSADEVLESMLQAMAFRGPDGEGSCSIAYRDWKILLGHRRLSILDITGGKQPMQIDGHWITFNGEIYNYLDLKRELVQEGVTFRTSSDTEILLQWLIHRGEAGISAVDGMFAFAWWNHKDSSLILARDRIGIKPLYYFHDKELGFSFSSNLFSLRKDSRIPFKISSPQLQTYFYLGYSGKDESILDHVKKIRPGTFLRWSSTGEIETKTFWRYKRETIASRSESEWLELLDSTLAEAVKKSLASDVPVGLFLSGGTDSTLLAHYANKVSESGVRSFHISYQEKSFDESKYAKAVAAHYGIPFEMDILTAKELLENIDSALDSLDEPISDHSMLPTFFLCKLAARRGKVFLGGDGGDELFGGYASYRASDFAKIVNLFPKFTRTHLVQPLVNSLPSSDRYLSFDWKAKRFFNRWNEDPRLRHLGWMGISDPGVASSAMKGPIDVLPLEKYVQNLDEDPSLGMNVDLHTYLPEYVLAKLDRASMRCSLEVRPPLLSNSVIQLSAQLPDSFKVRGGETKYLLKKLAAMHLPGQLVYRPKQGFTVPLTLWTRTALSNRIGGIMRSSPVWDYGLNRENWNHFWQEHQNRKGSYAGLFWSLIVLDHWLRKQ
jgi:asparagine synthase (glutamine-hydrolysing)